MTGIAYNDKLTDPVLSMDDLLDEPEAQGQGHAAQRDGGRARLVMLANGDDPTKVTDATFNKAIKRIKAAVDSGQIRQFTGNDYAAPLAKGDLAAAMAWSGDVVQLRRTTSICTGTCPTPAGTSGRTTC